MLYLLLYPADADNFIFSQTWSLKLKSTVELRTYKLTNKADISVDKLGGASITLTKAGAVVLQTQSDGGGDFIRDYLHVADAADAFLMTFLNSSQLSDSVYNIGTGKGISIIETLEMIIEKANQLTGLRSPIVHADFPQDSYSIERRNSIADSSRFRNATKWAPKINLMEGIQKTLEDIWASTKNSS